MASKLKLTELLYPTSTTAAITINSDDSVTIPTQSTTTITTSGNVTVGGTLAVGGGNISPQTGFKNRIINGAMTIDQRNNGALIPSAGNQYTVDRWVFYNSQVNKLAVGQNAGASTPPEGFKNYLGFVSLSAYSLLSSDYFVIDQPIEGLNVYDLDWGTPNAKTITISFKVYSSLTGTFGGSISNSAGNRSYPFTYTVATPLTWGTASVTIPGDTTGTWLNDNGLGIRVRFSLGVGSSNQGTPNAWQASNANAPTGAVSVVGTNGATFYITGVQLEKGSTATPFEFRSIGTELALCERYFQTITSGMRVSAMTFNSTVLPANWIFKTTMRAAPTTTATVGASTILCGGSNLSVTSIGGGVATVYNYSMDVAVASGATAGFGAELRLSGGRIDASAEL